MFKSRAETSVLNILVGVKNKEMRGLKRIADPL